MSATGTLIQKMARQGPAAGVQLERLHHDGQRGGKHDRPAQALHGTERHDPGFGQATAGRQAAQRR
jgi:hypothetical protein